MVWKQIIAYDLVTHVKQKTRKNALPKHQSAVKTMYESLTARITDRTLHKS